MSQRGTDAAGSADAAGITDAAGVQVAAAAGADAVLIGSVLSTSDDPLTLLRALVAVPRRSRG